VSAIRVVAIAAGSHIFGGAHARAIEENGLEVVAAYDLDPARAHAVADPRGWPVVESLEEALATPADLAVIASPHPLHADLAIRALDAGMHVLVEKPLASRPSEARAMAEAAERAKRVLAVALQHRFREEVRRAREIVRSGVIGSIHRAVVVSTYPKRAEYYRAAPWRGTWAGEGGGVLLNQGQHDLDTLVHLLGMPTRVMGWARTRALPIEAEDTVEAMLEWENGTLGSVHVTSAASDPPSRIELVGSKGALRLTPGALDVSRHPEDFADFTAAPGGPFDPFPHGEPVAETGGAGTHSQIYADLVAAIGDGRDPVAPASDALPALELTTAIILSSHLGAPLQLPLDAGEYDRMLDHLISTTNHPGETP